MQHNPITDEQLGQIESTITDEHLTPGPWDLAYEACDCGGDYPCGHGAYVTGVITPVPTSLAADRCKRTGEEPRDYDFHRGEIGDFTEADWVLMVSARQNVGTLLAEVRRQRDRIAELERIGTPRTPRICECGHSHLSHTVPAPHSCFAYGQTCECPAYRQMSREDALAHVACKQAEYAERAAASASAVAVSGGEQ